MPKIHSLFVTFALALLLSACATPVPPNVGQVVVAPKLQLPPLPELVERVAAKPPGFFQQTLLDCCGIKEPQPTK